jgi:hypothetical protein
VRAQKNLANVYRCSRISSAGDGDRAFAGREWSFIKNLPREWNGALEQHSFNPAKGPRDNAPSGANILNGGGTISAAVRGVAADSPPYN